MAFFAGRPWTLASTAMGLVGLAVGIPSVLLLSQRTVPAWPDAALQVLFAVLIASWVSAVLLGVSAAVSGFVALLRREGARALIGIGISVVLVPAMLIAALAFFLNAINSMG